MLKTLFNDVFQVLGKITILLFTIFIIILLGIGSLIYKLRRKK